MFNNLQGLPPLKVSDKQKNKDWAKKCLDAADTVSMFSNTQLRQLYYTKATNYNLYNNIVDRRDIERAINPHGLDIQSFPSDYRHIGIGNALIRKLGGEHLKRRFDYRAVISSKDEKGISSKEEQKMNFIRERVAQIIQTSGLTEEQIQKEIERTQEYATYSWQDLREQTANKLLKYYYYQQNLQQVFNENFYDLLIAGEAITVVEEIRGELRVRKGNPLNFFTIANPDAKYFEESDLIVEYGFKLPGEIIDDFGDELTSSEIDSILAGQQLNKGMGVPYTTQNINISIDSRYGLAIPIANETSPFSGLYRQDGSIRVIRCWWRAYRKIGVLQYLDDLGAEQEKFVSEYYKPDEAKGEYIKKWIWVTDWWQGYKIGGDIYVGCKPVVGQNHSFKNPSRSTPPVIGTITATNSNRAQSFMDICKPFDYHYNLYYYQRELLTTSNLGSILKFPITLKPENMTMAEWMYYVQLTKMMPYDPSREIVKGPAQGSAAGNFNAFQADVIHFDQGQLIEQITRMMESVKMDMHMVTGVLPGRLGASSPTDTATGINNEVVSSVDSTEIWYNYMDYHKKRVLQKILETSKLILKDNPLKAQYILDDFGIAMLETFDDFLETEYDLHISYSGKEAEIFNKLEQLFHAAMQNGQAKLSHIAQMYLNDSTQVALRKLQHAEEKNAQEQQQMAQMAEETKKQIAAENMKLELQKLELERMKLELEKYKIDQDNLTKIRIKSMESLAFDEGDDGEAILKIAEHSLKENEAVRKFDLESKKLNIELEKINHEKSENAKDRELEREQMKNDENVAKINARSKSKAK